MPHQQPERNEDLEARRKYAIWGVWGGIAFQTIFAIFSRIQMVSSESIFDASSVLLLLGVLYLLTRTSKHFVAYRLAIFTMVYIGTYTATYSGHETISVILAFYAVPVVLFYLLGIKEGLFWLGGVFAPVLLIQVAPSLFGRTAMSATLVVSAWASIGTVSAFAATSEWFRQKTWRAYIASNNALKKATQQLEQLEGFVPICSYCKNIRDDKGYWGQLEDYLAKHTHAHISSGVCDNCATPNSSLKKTSSFPVPAEIDLLSNWREDVDQTKRRFIQYAVALGIPIMWAFITRDFLAGNYIGSAGQAGLSVLLIVIALRIHITKNIGVIYQLVVAAFFTFLVLPFFSPMTNGTEHLWFLLFPLVAALILNFRPALVWTVGMLLFSIALFTMPYFSTKFSTSIDSLVFFTAIYALIGFLTVVMKRIRSKYTARIVQKTESLEITYASIKTLKGLVPVCSVCKSVRNDDGFWEHIDTYLLNRTELMLSHSICSTCLKKEMPELYDEMKSNGEL